MKKTRRKIAAALKAKIALEVRDARHCSLQRLSPGACGKRQRSEAAARIDELFTRWPFLGLRRTTAMLPAAGCLDQPQTCPAADAADGDRRPGAQAAAHEARARAY